MRTFRKRRHPIQNNQTAFIQPKLNIGRPGDRYELEADAMADKVVNRTPSGSGDTIQKMENPEEELQQKPLAASITTLVQRQTDPEEENVQAKCATCENEETVQKMEEEEEILQTKSKGKSAPSSSLETSLRSSKGGGSPLSTLVKGEMESGFGADFRQVNIHTNDTAIQMNQDLGAQAFTHGNDVYFNQGKYNPNSKEGKQLLAHELTHTIQQGASKEAVQRKLSVEDDYPSDYVTKLQSAFEVNDPQGEDPSKVIPNTARLDLVKTQLGKLSPHFSMDSSGNVSPNGSKKETELAEDDKATGSCCLHVLTRAASTNEWQILVADHLAPHTLESQRKVLINSNLNPVKFGFHNKTGKQISYEPNPELILAHELCGHASLIEIGAHAEGKRAVTNVHDSTINIENEIAKSLGKIDDELRGSASSGPHKGESFGHSVVIDFGFNKHNVNALDKKEKDKLKLLSDMIRTHDLFVEIRGHSDNVGSEGAKQDISDKRAKNVAVFLSKLGVAQKAGVNIDAGNDRKIERFLLKGMSDKEPLPGIDPTTEQHKLRRADVFVASFPAGLSEPPPGISKGVQEKLKKFDEVPEPAKVPEILSSGSPCESLLVKKAFKK